ncbi:MAG: SDR family oxidoreductase [Acidobacteriia bacterium]|nr:SDR family oxidoreductase [Terriglobia bacterium]
MNPIDNKMRGRVEDKVALVTGGASGIGQAVAILLAKEGARVVVADLDESGAIQTTETITAAGGIALARRLDVTSDADWHQTIQFLEQTWGPPDVLVQSAGISFAKAITEMTLEEWRHVMAVNLDSIFLGTCAGIKSMQQNRRGSIINVASASGIKASPGASAYCASKAGVIHFSKTAALECIQRGDNIRINSISPGGVRTPMWSNMPNWAEVARSEPWNAPVDTVPLKRFAEPAEIAQAVMFLASDESSYITGTDLVVDGGYTA